MLRIILTSRCNRWFNFQSEFTNSLVSGNIFPPISNLFAILFSKAVIIFILVNNFCRLDRSFFSREFQRNFSNGIEIPRLNICLRARFSWLGTRINCGARAVNRGSYSLRTRKLVLIGPLGFSTNESENSRLHS